MLELMTDTAGIAIQRTGPGKWARASLPSLNSSYVRSVSLREHHVTDAPIPPYAFQDQRESDMSDFVSLMRSLLVAVRHNRFGSSLRWVSSQSTST